MSIKKRQYSTIPGVAKAPSGVRVLIVEDNTALRGLMADVLEREGCTVTKASDISSLGIYTPAGENCYSDEPFDLIIADIHKPGEDGLVFLEIIRRSGCNTPAVVVTAYPEFTTHERANQLRATLLPKPFTLAELREVTAAVLQPTVRSFNGR